ncbi:MAG: hypothetical protein R3343_12575 [Nitriliruptorales bacterium]|nr:hypothetical protein [Nitriliruptorales bacterium]
MSTVTCRCEVLNTMSGDAARDYANGHLDEVRADRQGVTYYRCPETGVGLVEERAPSAHLSDTRRLRRVERGRV